MDSSGAARIAPLSIAAVRAAPACSPGVESVPMPVSVRKVVPSVPPLPLLVRVRVQPRRQTIDRRDRRRPV